MLGVLDGTPFAEGVVTLRPADFLVLFSDGITEAMNDAGRRNALPRLQVPASATGGTE